MLVEQFVVVGAGGLAIEGLTDQNVAIRSFLTLSVLMRFSARTFSNLNVKQVQEVFDRMGVDVSCKDLNLD